MLVHDLDYHADYQVDESGQLKHLLMIHPDSLRLFRDYAPDILMLDCTYRTNMYKQPLLNIIGAIGSNSTINLGVAILTGETASDFHPVIQALSQFLGETQPKLIITDRQLALTNVLDRCLLNIPHLLCSWHSNKDVRENTFQMGDDYESKAEMNGRRHQQCRTFNKCITQQYV